MNHHLTVLQTSCRQRPARLPGLVCGLLTSVLCVFAVAEAPTLPDPPVPVVVPVSPGAESEDDFALPLFSDETNDGTESLDSLKARRFDELRRQVEELRKRWPKESSRALESSVPVNEVAASEAELAPAPPEPESDASLSEGSTVPHELSGTSALQPPVGLPGIAAPAVEGQIDRFALATSLFGGGELESCLQILREVDTTGLSPESRVWGEYVQACCLRKLGRMEEAQKSYRRILADENAGWIGELARWWLDEIDQKDKLLARVSQLNNQLTEWEKQVESLLQGSN